MSTVIRKLAWSRLAHPRVAVTVSGLGLLLGLLVGATAPNTETLPLRLPLSHLLPSLSHEPVLAWVLLYTGDVLACLGLAGMLWAHSQGWRPNPRHLLLATTGIVAVMVCLTPVGSSDTASYAAYGRITSLGLNPYTINPQVAGSTRHVSTSPPSARSGRTAIGLRPDGHRGPVVLGPDRGGQRGHHHLGLMILNGTVFIGVGVLLLKTSDDPVRATLFWSPTRSSSSSW